MADDDEDPPPLRVVSNNPNARNDRRTAEAKERVQNAFARFAAALLRTMAGSDSEAIYLFRRLSDFVQEHRDFNAISGQWLTGYDLKEALRLPEADLDSSAEDWAYRRWTREHGLDVIVQGALRLAAHKVLGERPHFGGKHSEDVIKQGIEILEELKQHPLEPMKSAPTENRKEIDLGPSVEEKASWRRRKQGFGAEDLKELRRAIKAKDEKRIVELTSKIGRPSFDDKPPE
jgi:hypothetical protein